MPTITNFGDVVTVGNAAVNGTGTSSFAGPVTFAQGVSITGSVSTSSAFYGTLAGLNTASVSTLTASTNVYAPIVTTPISNAATAIATTGFYGALVGSNIAAVTVLTASTNVNAPTINVTSLNVSSQANVTTLNVSGFTSLFEANVITANVTSLNVSTRANVTSLNVSATAFLSNANVLTGNVTSLNVSTQANVTSLNVSATAFLSNANVLTGNVTSLNVSTQANVTFLNVSSSAFLSNANVLTGNVTSLNVSTQANVTFLNVSSTAFLSNANVLTANVTSLNVSTQANVTFLNVSSTAFLSNANVLTGNVTSLNVSTQANVTSLNVSATAFLSNANVLTGNVTSLNVSTRANITSLNVSSTAFLSNANVLTANISVANVVSLNVTGDANVTNVTVLSNLYTSNIIMSSNLSTNTGYGNVYLTGNLVVAGNIYSVGGSVGSGSGTSQGVLYSLGGAGYPLGAPFITGSAGPAIAGYHINLSSFNPEAVASVSAFSATSGMLKFATGGLYQVTCVIVGDQPVVKLAFGKTSSSSFNALPATATAGYDYVYNFPVNSSPSTIITIPLTVQDTSQYYYLDVFFSTVAGPPTTLYPTRSTTAVGSAYGTYVQVGPFGNYLTSATGVASGLLMNAYGTTTLSSPVTSNTFRLAMTSSNGWTVSGVSSSLTVTSGGNFQVSQVGIYEVSMCLNTSVTPLMFGVGSLASDTAPSTQGPYLYQYAPMYTQDPTTVVTLPLNITDTSKYYYLDVIFPGTQATVGLSNVSTFVSLKPVGSYVSPSTNPWSQQGTSVTYSGGAVAIGGVNPSALTETFTVNGNTAFVGNVTVTSDASGDAYVLADRIPAGSRDVTQYVTGSVPLTTTTNLIQKYLSNAATIGSNVVSGTSYSVLNTPPSTVGSAVNFGSVHSASLSNLALSNLFIEAWVNLSTATGTQAICGRRPGDAGATTPDFNLYLNSGQPVFIASNVGGSLASSSNTTALVAGAWYHVAASWQRTGVNTGTVRVFTNGGLGGTTGSFTTGTNVKFNPAANVYISSDSLNQLFGNIYDVRIMTNCIVPTATFTAPTFGPFTTAPTYRAGMDTGYTSNLTLALQTSYFPGASTSPYGPCLTLPGTVGSYYAANVTALDTTISSRGFCIEAWVNYASFANSAGGPTSSPATSYYPYTILKADTPGTNGDWFFGATPGGAVSFYQYGSLALITANNVVTTGQWTHITAQCNGSNIFCAVNGTFQVLSGTGGYSPAGGNGTIAPTAFGVPGVSGRAITLGQYGTTQGPNYSVAKARITIGTVGSPSLGNVYSAGNFTVNPNFAPVPAGATVAWSLESQYPLPTYPSFFDVPVLPQQTPAYGAEPVVVGGVTSNVVGPFGSSYPQLDSIRFDGTGYIDYGNSASSVLCSNLWASPWTIEGWVYPTAFPGGQNFILGRGNDFMLYITTAQIGFATNIGSATNYNAGAAGFAVGSWSHVAVTFDGTRSNVYVGGALSNTIPVSAISTPYTPTSSFQVGIAYNTQYQGNLADLRVSNVARYTGSSYTVPTAPFVTDRNTLLLLKSLGGQVGTTLEVQGRGLNAVSLGATQTVRAYPPAPMYSYLLDTTSNALVTYGQGKYVASASSENATYSPIWCAFDKVYSSSIKWISNGTTGTYSTTPPYNYTGSVNTVDTLGNSYPGEWVQLQLPVSIILSSVNYSFYIDSSYESTKLWVLGSRDGINWTLVATQAGITSLSVTINVSTTQAYNYYRIVLGPLYGAGGLASASEIIFYGTEESICVTSDSKVGVGIANPQRALEVAGDLVVSGTISGGAGMGAFRNRIINGDMRIAQRGTSNVINGTATVYLIDRFACPSGGGTLTQTQQTLSSSDSPYQVGFRNSWRMTCTVAQNPIVYLEPAQAIEGYNIADLNWGTPFGVPVTVSFWFRTNLSTGSIFCFSVRDSAGVQVYPVPFAAVGNGAWQYVTGTVPPPPNGTTINTGNTTGISLYIGPVDPPVNSHTPFTWTGSGYAAATNVVNWYATAGNYIEFTGVQLEKGTVATPFEFRPYAHELALCQRYFTQLGGQSVYNFFGSGIATSGTVASIIVPLPTNLRSPSGSTLTVNNIGGFQLTGNVAGASSSIAATAITLPVGTQNINSILLNITVASGLGTNWPYVLNTNNNLLSYIQINNEL